MWKQTLWKHNKISKCDKIQMWKRDYCGKHNKNQECCGFQCGKETFVETQLNQQILCNSNVEQRLLWKAQLIIERYEISIRRNKANIQQR